MRATFVIVATLLLLACGEDPILTRAKEDAAAAGASGDAAAAPSPGTAGAPDGAPGVAPDPPRGDPSSPPPGGAPGTPPAPNGETPEGVAAEPVPVKAPDPPPAPQGSPGGGAPGIPGSPAGPGVPGNGGPPGAGAQASAATVTVTGTVQYSAWKKGEVRIDAFDGDHSVHGTHPGVVASARIAKPGTFTLTVPEGAGKLYIEAVVDEDLDGRPGPQDPMGTAERYPVTVATSPVDGLSINLVKHEAPADGKGKGDF